MTETHQYVSYQHKDAPNGPEFIGMANSIPPWAVNVKYDDGTPKNNAGLPPHETDMYIHWQDNQIETMKKLRSAYQKIEEAGLLNELNLLLTQSYQAGKREEHELNNPDN